MITLHKIFEIYRLDPAKIKLVRHGNKEIPIHETFKENLPLFEAYQCFQKPKKFGNADAIAVFAPYHKTTALFLGLWDISDCTQNSQFTNKIMMEIQKYGLPKSWLKNLVRYNLKRNNILDDLSERLVIEWGAAAVTWVQSKDKEVIELKGKRSIGDFQSFGQINLDFNDLKTHIQGASATAATSAGVL